MASILSGNEHNNDSQRPEVYTMPTKRLHNIRNASGRFRKVEAIETRKETKIKILHEGFKTWNAKGSSSTIAYPRKTNPQQNEWHEHLRSVHFSLSGSLEFLVRFSCPACPNYRPTCSVDSNPDSHQQNTAKRKANLPQGSRLVDIQTLTEGLKECSFCHCGKYSLFFTAL